MAFIKSKTLDSGAIGDYWRIIQRNSNFDRNDDVCTLKLYINEQGRVDDLTPLSESVKFNFCPQDHPLSEIDVDEIDINLVDDFRDVELHVRYVHIRDIANIAFDKIADDEDAELTRNEQRALFFVDAVDATGAI